MKRAGAFLRGLADALDQPHRQQPDTFTYNAAPPTWSYLEDVFDDANAVDMRTGHTLSLFDDDCRGYVILALRDDGEAGLRMEVMPVVPMLAWPSVAATLIRIAQAI